MLHYSLLYLVPKNLESYCLGKISRTQLPNWSRSAVNQLVVKALGIDMSEAAKPLSAYTTIEDLFTRGLAADARPISEPFCSPCDGILRYSQLVDRGQGIQAKGLHYSINSLLFDKRDSPPPFDAHWNVSLYLAPHHYHRVHAPFSGKLLSIHYVPGELWPVNEPFVRQIPRLYCRNERVVLELEHESGGRGFLVMVGALNVGRIRVKGFPTFATNSAVFAQKAKPKTRVLRSSHKVKIGDELATFALGSSVVMVLDQRLTKLFALKRITESQEIRMGNALQ